MPLDLLALAAQAPTPEAVAMLSVAGLAALATLTLLEVVLGIDNIVFLAVLTDKLPEEKQPRVRTIGLMLAMVMRLILLAGAWLITRLDTALFDLPFLTEHATDPDTGLALATTIPIAISAKDILLLVGGLFLIAKATHEIHNLVEPPASHDKPKSKAASVRSVLIQVVLLDIVFSMDSVITAVGMTSNYWIMSTAVVIAVAVMMVFAGPIARFVNTHPSTKTLALAFLVLIGVLLVADGMHQHLSRGYVYFAMAFALGVEIVNIKAGARQAEAQA